VAYRVKQSDWQTDNVLSRNFNTPPELRTICLEESDFRKSSYQLGHLYGLQLVSARQEASEVNQMCAIAVQTRELNTGPWLQAENRIRKASETETVTVIAGQLWIDKMPALPNADEPHKVASHCWMIFTAGKTTEAYLIPQIVKRTAQVETFAIKPEKLRAQISDRWIGGDK
jgi:endonuclease G